ncbi:MAG: hypothetical protein WC558_05150 [Patulibacter sp.]
MRAAVQQTTSTENVMTRKIGRWLRPAAVALVVGAAGMVSASAASAAEPVEFAPDSTSIRAMDAAGDEVTQAGAHPDRLEIKFEIATTGAGNTLSPTDAVKDIEITLPEGLQGNPEATPKCPMATFTYQPQDCPAETQVGRHVLFYRASRGTNYEYTTLYNLVPPKGVVARFGMKVLPVPVMLDMSVKSDGSYAIVTNIRGVGQGLQLIGSTATIWGVPAANNGSTSPRVPLLTMGSECGVERSATIRLRAWRDATRWIEANPLMPALTGCDRLQFKPSLDLRPVSTVADAPSGYRFQLKVPQSTTASGLGTPPLKRAEILFPEGVAVSPGGANGLTGCSDAQSGIGTLDVPSCPAASRIGSVRIDTPVLDLPMDGGVYLGTPKSQDAQSGEMFRIFLLAEAKGVIIKQEGNLFPDPVTGRLRAVFDNAPRQPFEAMTVELDNGPHAALVNPPRCGTFTTSATMTSWSGQTATSDSSFEIACRPGLGAFAPGFQAGTASLLAGASSPFNLSIAKQDGQSPLNGVSLMLPKGLLANLKGNIGTQVGTVTALAGSGAAPYALPGKVYLEGAYGDAPFSLKVVVPAKAGPFDFGEVVVKQKLYVDPIDAHVTIQSDPIPTILQGVPTRIQRLDVSVDKPGFMVNPTSCEPMTIGGALASSTGQVSPISTRFQVGACAALDLEPKLALAWTDKSQMKKGKHPGVEATVAMPKGGANLRNVQVTLPLTAALDPDNAKALCEAAAAAARICPEASIVGSATATTPALDVPVSGPVYFVKGTRTTKEGRVVPTLPKLYMKLSGQGVTIDLHADSSVTGPAGKQKLVTTFTNVPDVPVDTFRLQINSGANGILKATNDVCGADKVTGAVFTGHNGRVTRSSLRFTAPECAPQVVSTSGSATAVSVRVGGITAGRLTLKGSRIANQTRTVRASDAATLTVRPRLTSRQKALLTQGRTVKITVQVAFKPTKGKAVSWKRNIAIHGVKRSTR